MGLLFDDPLFEQFGMRALGQVVYAGADVGECLVTAERITAGDIDSYHREWVATADRVAAIADESAGRGHRVSAREAYLRASTYYRVAYFPLYGRPIDPRLAAAFGREMATFAQAA